MLTANKTRNHQTPFCRRTKLNVTHTKAVPHTKRSRCRDLQASMDVRPSRGRGGSWKKVGRDGFNNDERGRGRGGHHRGRGKRDHYRGRGRGDNIHAALHHRVRRSECKSCSHSATALKPESIPKINGFRTFKRPGKVK